MRNYFKMFSAVVYGHSSRGSGSDLSGVVWADTKSMRSQRVLDVKTGIQSSDPFFPYTFSLTEATVYFELNKAFFGVLLNGGASALDPNYNYKIPSYVWDAITGLPPGTGFPDYPGPIKTGFYDAFTVVEHPSPRATWSHGH